jgi:hypothetical protein
MTVVLWILVIRDGRFHYLERGLRRRHVYGSSISSTSSIVNPSTTTTTAKDDVLLDWAVHSKFVRWTALPDVTGQ